MVKTMSKDLDFLAVERLLLAPLIECTARGTILSPADARLILKNWDEYRKICDDKPMTTTEVQSRRESLRPGSVSFVECIAEPPPVNVTLPAMAPGNYIKVTEPGGVVEYKYGAMQSSLMTHDPATGAIDPYPSQVGQYRAYHGKVAWMFNPWTGEPRNPLDIGSDVFGYGIKESTND